MADDAYRISAGSLRRRALVRTSGRGPNWRAEITAAGREYIDQASGPNPPIPRQASTSVTEQLVNDVANDVHVRVRQFLDRGVVSEYRGIKVV